MEVFKTSKYLDRIDEKNKIYILLGNTNEFINDRLSSLSNNLEFYYIYKLSVFEENLISDFVRSNISCPFSGKIDIKRYEEYRMIIGSCVLNNEEDFLYTSDSDAIYVYVLCYLYKEKLRTLTMIKFHHLLTTSEKLRVDDYILDDLSFFYTCPERIKKLNIPNADSLYKNIFLRKEINSFIKNKSSNLSRVLEKIVRLEKNDVYKIFVADEIYENRDLRKLLDFDYNKDKILAFIRAWYSGQLSFCEKDNELIKRMYLTVEQTI
ncbi:ORF-40 [Teiidae poxvirus 1]|nr:ORF-40 [Teiidae poxvirus 1]